LLLSVELGNSFDVVAPIVFPCHLTANGLREAADPMEEGAGQVTNRMRLTNSWVGCPAVARPCACGLAHIELHGAPTKAVMGADARSYVAVKPFSARPIEESP
jgi:hypothetical protein